MPTHWGSTLFILPIWGLLSPSYRFGSTLRGSTLWGSTLWGSTLWGSTLSILPIWEHTVGVYTLGLYTLGVYTLGVYSLAPPIWELAAHLPVLKKHYRGPFNVNVV